MYIPEPATRKGDNGKLLIIAGGKKYHGSALLAVKAAVRFTDLVYFYATNNEGLMNAIKQIPEVIIEETLNPEKYDAVLIGPGMLPEEIPQADFEKAKKLILDGGALHKKFLESLQRSPERVLILPHEGEFKRLFGLKGDKENVVKMAKKWNVCILRKGQVDVLSDGERIKENILGNPGLTKGGTGDALAGFISALATKNDLFESAYVGVSTFCKAADSLFEEKLFYYSPSDVIEELPKTLAKEIVYKLRRQT